ncbi:Protein ULTRAPETALA 2 [Hirschfeldia incana]|nr:Protein ULTRAPETALA 2 [Hirschfeldia incana]
MERECRSKKTLFSEEELQEISGVIVGDDYVEVMCGCTSHRTETPLLGLGFSQMETSKSLANALPLAMKLSPAAFEKHSERETSRNWRNNVWVFIEGDKVPLAKTVLLRYYNQTLKTNSNGSKVIHRDEFVGCSRCGKERRFRLRSRGECRKHHDALVEPNWKCCDYPYHKITCDEEEERVSRKVYRGCTRSASCKGCTSCVCFGCKLCRYSDCNCQTCFDFTTNTKPI